MAKGFHQTHEVDHIETFSPIVKASIVKLVLSLAIMNKWTLRQTNINNAFLNGILVEDVYKAKREGFIDTSKPNHICKLKKTFYGLKQALRA